MGRMSRSVQIYEINLDFGTERGKYLLTF
ncbi:hypothetical protein LINPERPRIM_LOCUS21630 [Linum perenne]